MAIFSQTNSYFRASCIVGLLLSFYALFVELKKEENDKYKAYCDINEHISCTRAFSSEYGKGFGIIGKLLGENSILNQPNSVAGIIFYILLILLSYSNEKTTTKLQIIFCIISNFMSVYLAYILYYILSDFCVICVATYIVNAINLVLSIKKWNLIKNQLKTKGDLRKKSGYKNQ